MYRMVSSPCGEYGNGARGIQDAIFLIVSIPGDDATLNLHNLLALCFSRIHCQIKREVAFRTRMLLDTKKVDLSELEGELRKVSIVLSMYLDIFKKFDDNRICSLDI